MIEFDRGFIIILSAPSGTGKSTLASHLVRTMAGVHLSVSTTTRQPRGQEISGQDYFFVDQASFRASVDRGEFLEWAEVFGNCYGTAWKNVEPILQRGENVLLDIDWQGAQQVRAKRPAEEVVSISILPPSCSALQQRLKDRGTDDAQVIRRRMEKAGAEISHWREYDYLLINDDLVQAQKDLVAIVTAERLRRLRSEFRGRTILSTFTE